MTVYGRNEFPGKSATQRIGIRSVRLCGCRAVRGARYGATCPSRLRINGGNPGAPGLLPLLLPN